MPNVDQLTIEVVDCSRAGSGGRVRTTPDAEYRISKLQRQSYANANDRRDEGGLQAVEQSRNS
jgi:hypothetical protein